MGQEIKMQGLVIGHAKAHDLHLQAIEKSIIIRRRLAAVAQDLRAAAATAGPGSEHLLHLASKFEHQSRAGDNL